MKIVERLLAGLFGIAMLYVIHQLTGVLMKSHGWRGLSPSDWASWVQAAGATLAIGLAVWLPRKDRAEKARDEAKGKLESQRRVCMAFRDELSILESRLTNAPNVIEILRDAPGEVFDREIPASDVRFPIFRATIGRLTEVDNTALRHGVISVYEYAEGTMQVAGLNNRHLRAFVELARESRRNGTDIFDGDLDFMQEVLVSIRVQLRQLAMATLDQLPKTLALLNAEIDRLDAT